MVPKPGRRCSREPLHHQQLRCQPWHRRHGWHSLRSKPRRGSRPHPRKWGRLCPVRHRGSTVHLCCRPRLLRSLVPGHPQQLLSSWCRWFTPARWSRWVLCRSSRGTRCLRHTEGRAVHQAHRRRPLRGRGLRRPRARARLQRRRRRRGRRRPRRPRRSPRAAAGLRLLSPTATPTPRRPSTGSSTGSPWTSPTRKGPSSAKRKKNAGAWLLHGWMSTP
mmetsp:Transcript_41250/g.114668  ORF Transcript_41250/g.114668 Transcript_41250/m.114668 type:complete len:219 (+) Transcript_41250:438-1094(+)